MTFVYVAYRSVSDLVARFSNLDIPAHAVVPEHTHPAPNFVLVNPDLYYGSYGGILARSLLADREGFVADPLDDDLCLVWWAGALPALVGDVYALSADGRKAVTPSMFRRMCPNKIFETRPVGSAYYTCDRAWRMNFESSSYSDSE